MAVAADVCLGGHISEGCVHSAACTLGEGTLHALQEPVDPLKQEYKQAVNGLEDILGNEATQKV